MNRLVYVLFFIGLSGCATTSQPVNPTQDQSRTVSKPVEQNSDRRNTCQSGQGGQTDPSNNGRVKLKKGLVETYTWTGPCQNGLPHGSGIQIWFVKGTIQGKQPKSSTTQASVSTDGMREKFEGEIREGKYNGNGKLTRADGTIYEGEFVAGKFTGFGITKGGSEPPQKGLFENGQLLLACPNKIACVKAREKQLAAVAAAEQKQREAAALQRSRRTGGFEILPNQPTRSTSHSSMWTARCDSGGLAYVIVDDETRNMFCRGGAESPGGCNFGVGIETSLAKACRGE
jgi:hypothetical protein